MTRLKFSGPEKLRGLDLPMIKPGHARLKDLVDLQRATGMTMAQIQDDVRTMEAFAFLVVIYQTVRAAGIPIPWHEVEDLQEEWIDLVQEPGDDRSSEGSEPDPTSAPTASAPDAVVGDEPATKSTARRKQTSRGSKSRSADA